MTLEEMERQEQLNKFRFQEFCRDSINRLNNFIENDFYGNGFMETLATVNDDITNLFFCIEHEKTKAKRG